MASPDHSCGNEDCFCVSSVGSVIRLKRGPSTTFDPTRVSQLSSKPRAFLYKGFLSEEECDHMINLAKNKLTRSLVIDTKSGKSYQTEGRTSSGMFLSIAQDKVISNIESRIAAWTFLPIENGEGMQILRYDHGQKYDQHYDSSNEQPPEFGGRRVATVLMYLSNVEKGGGTAFPKAQVMETVQAKEEVLYDSAKHGYSVKPFKGDALLFFTLLPDATLDRDSLHEGCPVIEGEKWAATKWIHVGRFQMSTNKLAKADNNVPRRMPGLALPHRAQTNRDVQHVLKTIANALIKLCFES